MDKQDTNTKGNSRYVLAFDSANEVISIGLGRINDNKHIEVSASMQVEAHRASNTRLIPEIDLMLKDAGVERSDIECVAAGRGPGSFTGVRICLATAKGIASALGVGLIGVSTLDAIAWGASLADIRGPVFVVADAMRKEIYPVNYVIDNDGSVQRQAADRVVKARIAAEEFFASKEACNTTVCGDALTKYVDLFGEAKLADKKLWSASGTGLLACIEDMWKHGFCDPTNKQLHNPGVVLPVYTRLSDAEETERLRLADTSLKNLNSGVQNPDATGDEITITPMDAKNCDALAILETKMMGSDAWKPEMFAAELQQDNRSWWTAVTTDGKIVGYAGAMVAGDKLEILKVAVVADKRRSGLATKLLSCVAHDCRDLGARSTILEVRASNKNAQMFYKSLGMDVCTKRDKYYSDKEDAIIMTGPLPIIKNDVGGMHLRDFDWGDKVIINTTSNDQVFEAVASKVNNNYEPIASECASNSTDATSKTTNTLTHPLIFAIESSCDETAASIICGDKIIADVVASQIDFHKRFGGVVPEIASRKHIEAICGVADECFECAAAALCVPKLTWNDIDAVAVTRAPGLVGALVVGMAFAKGAAWASNKKLMGINHLEGHMYANKLSDNADAIKMPAIASVISGGNTLLVQVENWGQYKTLGSTIDDAVGEAFDKVAKALCLGYPGGPIISKLATKGNPRAIDFPRAMMHSGDLNFSLSGLKTAVITYIQQNKNANINDICASFQAAVIDVQVEKARRAIRQVDANTFMFGGGVAANPALRAGYEKMCSEEFVELVMPPLSATGDNAAMIALCAADRYAQKCFIDFESDVAAHEPLDSL